MKNGSTERKDKQRTGKGLGIPVPKRSGFIRDLKGGAASNASPPEGSEAIPV